MSKFSIPNSILNKNIGHFEGKTLDMEILSENGLFIIRNYLNVYYINKLYLEYSEYRKSELYERTKFHLTEVKIPFESPLQEIIANSEFTNLVRNFFNGDVGLYNIRVVKKDKDDLLPVFLHQDIGYHIGGFERYSVFIPLTNCNKDNGGLTFYPGTNNYGYLGDVGEIKDFLPDSYPRLTPELNPGDVAIMHSALWHKSGENKSGKERVYIDIHIQSANEPTTKKIITGKRKSGWTLNCSNDFIFENSRTQKLKKLYKN